MLLIPDLSCCQNLSAPSQAIVLCPVTRVVPGAKATVYVESSSIGANAPISVPAGCQQSDLADGL